MGCISSADNLNAVYPTSDSPSPEHSRSQEEYDGCKQLSTGPVGVNRATVLQYGYLNPFPQVVRSGNTAYRSQESGPRSRTFASSLSPLAPLFTAEDLEQCSGKALGRSLLKEGGSGRETLPLSLLDDNSTGFRRSSTPFGSKKPMVHVPLFPVRNNLQCEGTDSQFEFFRMLDKKVADGPEYKPDSEHDTD